MSGPRKRRTNHNEIEKKRRDLQRIKLDELKRNLPRLDSDKPSAVTIITEATGYIRELDGRVNQLSNYIISSGLTLPVHIPQHISVPKEPHTMGNEDLFSFLQTRNSQPYIEISPEPPKHAKNSTSEDLKISRLLESSGEDNVFEPDQNQGHLLSGRRVRRDSSMLLPTSDPKTFLFGKRDSIHNLFSGSISTMFQDSSQQSITCASCRRGVDNLVMIDCDRCHNWHHTNCIGIEAGTIPLQWLCDNCTSPAAKRASLI